MKQWPTLKKDLLQNPAIAQEYADLELPYQLAAQLIELRLARGLTQAELAKKIGTRQSAIARLESGRSNPSIQLLGKIARATKTDLHVRFGSVDED